MRNESKGQAVLLFGMPGAGKGTQGKALGAMPGFIHVSSGEVFRNLNKLGRLGKQVAEHTSQGRLVPDDLTVQIFQQHLALLQKSERYVAKEDVLLLDGIPRTYRQAELLEPQLEVLLVFNLVIDDPEEAVHRIRARATTELRADDGAETIIRKRIEAFRQSTAETLRYYDRSRIVRVDASQRPMRVLNEMTSRLCDLPIESGSTPISA